MHNLTIDYLRKNNMIAYEYIRGSHAYGTNVEGSDKDIGGVYICPEETLYGLRSNYVEQVTDAKSDVVFYEFGRWIELLLKSNPTVLESLFIPEDCIIGEIHPAVQYIINHRDMFLTKEALNPLLCYAHSQILKHKGLHKKINIPEDFQRKNILDFCYTFNGQGSQPIKDWLKEHNLDQKYCGLVKIPNCRDAYGLYYDFAAYFKFEHNWADCFEIFGISGMDWITKSPYCKFIPNAESTKKIIERIKNKEFFHYKGIVEPDELTKSNEVRLSSIPKGEMPICAMFYNKDAYMTHCREYREWTEWKKNRNPVRYENNKGHLYDSKNMCHSIRLMKMGIELAEGKGFIVRRNEEDRKHLLAIRNHEIPYEEIMAEAESLRLEFDEKVKTTKLPEKIDFDKVNNLLIEVRKIAYFKNN